MPIRSVTGAGPLRYSFPCEECQVVRRRPDAAYHYTYDRGWDIGFVGTLAADQDSVVARCAGPPGFGTPHKLVVVRLQAPLRDLSE